MATESTAASASTCVNDVGGAIGMPQLCVEWMPNQVFWLLVTLVVMFFILKTIALPRIGAVLAERKGTITNDLAAAEELKQKAVDAERAFNDALATARAEAGKIVAAAKADIQKDLDKATAKADVEISARVAESEKSIAEIRAGAMEAVEAVAKDTAKELVAVLGGAADAKAVAAAVSARLKG
jgi:F-type H+-transporting ATPase subunit b